MSFRIPLTSLEGAIDSGNVLKFFDKNGRSKTENWPIVNSAKMLVDVNRPSFLHCFR
jgi:hypothetical protein